MTIPPLVLQIAHTVRGAGGRALLVGGCVRDQLLGLTPKDYDLEVFGVAQVDMETLLASCGQVSHVGRAFPVWKVWTQVMGQGQAIDVTLPRKETKCGVGHTDFEITLDPNMTLEEASSRRDVTMNAIGFDPLTGETLDPHDGITDIRRSEIVHVSHHFAEDPLRVLRVAQFAARFSRTRSRRSWWTHYLLLSTLSSLRGKDAIPRLTPVLTRPRSRSTLSGWTRCWRGGCWRSWLVLDSVAQPT